MACVHKPLFRRGDQRGVLGEALPEHQGADQIIEIHDQDGSGTLDQNEIQQAVIDSAESRQTDLGEWGDE